MAFPSVKRRKICVVTTTRADYGLLYWLMQEISEDPELELSVIAAGMHLSSEFGMTVGAIESDGFRIDRRIEMLISTDSEAAIVKSMGVEMISLADALREILPDFVVILGDRFEIVPVALAAVIFRIPVVHIHGGEVSQGAIDEAFRHAVTKMASVHFAATETYRNTNPADGRKPGSHLQFRGAGPRRRTQASPARSLGAGDQLFNSVWTGPYGDGHLPSRDDRSG